MNVVCLVPRRADHGRRDQLWDWVRRRWESEHPDIAVVEGHHDEAGLFSVAAARNHAAAAAGDWEIAVVIDSDSYSPPAQILAGIERCRASGQLTLVYDTYRYLSGPASDAVLAGADPYSLAGVEFTMTGTATGFAIGRDLWEACGGYDEGFVGWGFEDVAFQCAAHTLGGGTHHIAGDLFHLQHPGQARGDQQAGRDRLDHYLAATGDRAAMLAVLDGLRVTA